MRIVIWSVLLPCVLLLGACSSEPKLKKSTMSLGSEPTSYVFAELPKGALVITQSAWHTQNSEFLANPASLMKLITASLAATELGPDYRFKTQLSYDKSTLIKGTLHTPPRLIMGADPTFSLADLDGLLTELKNSGVETLHNFDIDVTHFSGHPWGIGQEWNDHGVCFAAPASAAIINRNCVFGNIKTGEVGSLTSLYIPPDSPLEIDNQVITVRDADAENCPFLLKVIDRNYYRLTGCLSEKFKYLPLGFSVNEPNLYLANIVQNELSKLGLGDKVGIRIIDSPRKVVKQDKKSIIFTHESREVRELILRMLHRSDNLIADVLFKEAGYQYMKREEGDLPATGSYESGERAAKAMLDALQINTENLVLRDGSGLSRENLVFADTFYRLLNVWQYNPTYYWLINELAVSGVSGTLKARETFVNSPLKGQVLAKTGSMNGVRNLAGYVKVDEALLPFVLMVNQFSRPDIRTDELSDQELKLYGFEKAFLQVPLANHEE